MTMTALSEVETKDDAFSTARRAMVDSQLRASGVTDPAVVAAMLHVPRENFVPDTLRQAAYIDRAIPLADGRSLAAPLVHGRMLDEAGLQADDTVLLIGDGQGYLAALLRHMNVEFTAVEPATLIGKKQLKEAYSLILIDGAVDQVPDSVTSTLTEGGRIVTGVVERGVTSLAAGRKVASSMALLPLIEMGVPVLSEFSAERKWAF